MLDWIKKRRSIRQYTDEPVSDADVKALLEAAMAAPSSSDRRPWEFIVVREKSLRQRLAQTHVWSHMVFVVCGDARCSEAWIEDTSAATENLLLAATALGLGAVWVGVHRNP
jgi:nitroreductase